MASGHRIVVKGRKSVSSARLLMLFSPHVS
jgi:hypothetical protein